jgi:uncharacterized protein YcfJ
MPKAILLILLGGIITAVCGYPVIEARASEAEAVYAPLPAPLKQACKAMRQACKGDTPEACKVVKEANRPLFEAVEATVQGSVETSQGKALAPLRGV